MRIFVAAGGSDYRPDRGEMDVIGGGVGGQVAWYGNRVLVVVLGS